MQSEPENKDCIKSVQYADSSNLDSRIALHKRYTDAGKDIWDFVWAKYSFEKGAKVLETGCGTGGFWKHQKALLPEGVALTLTDFSEGMLKTAERELAAKNLPVNYQVADVENLPYDSESFTNVLAHFMLYHTASKPRALREIKRVLKQDGWAGIILNAANHLTRPFELAEQIDLKVKPVTDTANFTAEEALPLIEACFSDVQSFHYRYTMKIDEVDYLLNYAKSSMGFQSYGLPPDFWQRYEALVQEEIDNKGFFALEKHSVLFICRK